MIYIFGGINLDVVAKIDGDAKINESNIANISLNAGGVGRNIARAVGNYTCAEFITCVPNDLYSNAVNELETNNISLKYSKFLHDQNSLNMYVDVVDNNGVVIGACDTKALAKFTEDDIKHILDMINDDDVVVIDANIPELVEYIVDNSKGFKILDAVSSIKLNKIKHIVQKLDFIKVNNFEYDIICSILPKNYLVTYGDGGEIVFNNERLKFKHKKLNPVNPTGCGDTFIGTFIANIDKPLKEAVIVAIKASAVCSQINDAVPTREMIDNVNEKDLEIVWL